MLFPGACTFSLLELFFVLQGQYYLACKGAGEKISYYLLTDKISGVKEIRRLTGEGVDVVFDPIGGSHLWNSRKALRPGGKVVGYGLISSIRGEGLASGRPGRRQRFRGTALWGLYIAGGWLLPGRKHVIPYSIQTLKRLKPELFRQDLITLFDLLQQKKIKPIIAHRFPLVGAKQAQELLEEVGVIG
jgi:NADPH:quinone reductase